MKTPKKTGKLVAMIPCEGCGRDTELRVSNEGNGFPYYSCPIPADGGCGRQTFTRNKASGKGLALKAKSWRSKADRAHWTGEAESPAGDKQTTNKPDQAPADPPADAPAKKESVLDRRIF